MTAGLSGVVLVDDHALILDGLKRAIERTGVLNVLGTAGSVREAGMVLAETSPAAVVCDVRLPDGSGIDLVRELRGAQPTLGLVVLTMHGDDDTILDAWEAGASALVGKDAPTSAVIDAILQSVERPTQFSCAGLADALARSLSRPRVVLDARERVILGHLVQGRSTAQISKSLGTSASTTKLHLSSLFDKLDVGNRNQAVAAAFRLGLTDGV